MADSEFDILIRMQADLSGAKESVAELRELKRQAVAAGVSTGDLDKQIGLAERQADGFQKKLEEAGEKGTGHIQGLHRAVNLLSRQFGELGHLAHGFMSLPALGITALAIGIATVVEHFSHLNEKIEMMQDKLRGLDLSRLDTMRKNAIDAAAAMREYFRQIDASRKDNDPFFGRSFASPQQELAQRRARSAELELASNAAAEAAVKAKFSPDAASTQDRLKLATEAREQLRRNIDTAGSVTASDTVFGTFGMMSPDQIQKALDRRTAKARAAFDDNEAIITSASKSLSRFASNQADLEQAAAIKKGLFTGNNARILALQGGFIGTEEERRRSTIEDLFLGGIKARDATRIPGVEGFRDARAHGLTPSKDDIQDYVSMINQIKVAYRAAFMKAIREIFQDGVATPEEIAKLRQDLKTWKQRP